MSKYKRLLSNTVILGTGTFASKVLVFLLMPLYTSILTTEQFGVADILTQTANLLIPLASVGICDGMFRFVLDTGGAEDTEARKRIFSSGVLVLAVGGAATLGVVQILRAFEVFKGYILLVAAYVLCSNLHSAAANFIRAEGKTTMFAVQGIVNTVLTIALNVLFLVVFEMGTLGYVLSVVVADLCVTIGLFFAARLYRALSVRSVNKSTLKEMLKFSIPYIPTTMMWLITSASDRYIVTAYCGSAENGLYAAAYKLPTLLTLVCGVFIEAWQFSVVKDADESEREGFFSAVFKNYMGIIFMGASLIIAGSKIFTSILLADSYYESWQYVPVLVISTAFSALVSFLGSVYFLEKKSVMSMATSMAGAAINVILNFALIPKRGAMGAAVATLISYAAVYAIRAYDTKFYVRFKLHTPKVIINTTVLILQSVVMIGEIPYWKYVQVAIVAFMLVFNGKDIFMALRSVFRKIIKKS
ncbi:MAG: polysaccharide biosynthesis C-terminal domain-containing protein [Clostridia bacterium]|nr:polysaccharide biosynthesis C-terminal domain-containing protein [Clostridia bacterium]